MEKVGVNGTQIAYERRGKGAPLVLIHGYPLDHTTWDPVATLLENDFELILPDLRGLGLSDPVQSVYTVADLASDITGLMDHLKIREAFLAGHSMGGYVALAIARAGHMPVRGLAMVSSQVLADPPDRKKARYQSAAEVAEKGVGVVAEAMTAKLSAQAEVQEAVRIVIERQKRAGVIGSLKAMAERPDSSAIFSEFKFPVVIVHGDADALIPVDRGREMKTARPSAHYLEMPGRGHMAMMEDSQAVAQALRYFTNPGS